MLPFLWDPPFQEFRVTRFLDAGLLNSSDGEGGICLLSSFSWMGRSLQRGFGLAGAGDVTEKALPSHGYWYTPWLIHTWGSAAHPNSWACSVS